jgi:hypothetical protein
MTSQRSASERFTRAIMRRNGFAARIPQEQLSLVYSPLGTETMFPGKTAREPSPTPSGPVSDVPSPRRAIRAPLLRGSGGALIVNSPRRSRSRRAVADWRLRQRQIFAPGAVGGFTRLSAATPLTQLQHLPSARGAFPVCRLR